MEIDIEEQEAPKDVGTGPSIPFIHPSYYQQDLVELEETVDLPRDVVMTRKRLAWLHDTLQDEEGYADPRGTFR